MLIVTGGFGDGATLETFLTVPEAELLSKVRRENSGAVMSSLVVS